MNDHGRLSPAWRTVVAALSVALVTATCRSGEGGDARLKGNGDPLPSVVPANSYRITYRIRELDRTREERIVVRRPYESRRTAVREGHTVSGTLTNRDGLWQWVDGADGGWQLVDPGRRRAEADARLLASLPLLVEAGLATVEGTDRVRGRQCVVVRTAEPIGNPATAVPRVDDYDEFCVDRTGVMLRERWVIDGRTVRLQEAIKLMFDPPIEDHREFEAVPAAPMAPLPVGKQLVQVTADILGRLDVGFDLPDDITADGAEGWLQRDPRGGVVGGSVRRFYRRGDDLAEVEEQESGAVSRPRDLRFPTALGDGFLESDLQQLTLHVPIAGGVTVVVRATSVELLTDLAQAMRRQDAAPDEESLPLEGARS